MQEDRQTLHHSYDKICEAFHGFKACSREKFFKVLSDPSLLSSREVPRNSRVCPTRKRNAIPGSKAPTAIITKASFPLSKPPLDHVFSSRPELGRPSLAAGNAGDEVDLALFKHWAGAALQLRAVDEEELERFGRSASL